MANVLSVIISVLFAGILVYMLGIYFKNRKYIIIKGKNMTRYRMLMLSALMFFWSHWLPRKPCTIPYVPS